MDRIKSPPSAAAPFCHVERRERGGGKRYYVVHAGAPRFVAEIESEPGAEGQAHRAVIRRVCLPNSWAGDYHISAKRLTDAVEFFEAMSQQRK